MLLAMVGMVSFASAQQTKTVTGYEVVQVKDKYQVLTNPFWSNWFFSAGGGAQVVFGNGDHIGKFKDRISPTLDVSVGKWFTPGVGLRMQYSGLKAKGFTTDGSAAYVTGVMRGDGSYKQSWDFMNLHGDVLFNLNALIGGYNPDRVYEVIPYIGAGFTHAYSRPHTHSATLNAGIINRFRITRALDLNLELSATGMEGKFDGEHGGKHDYDGILGATAGLTYYLPNRGFQRPVPQIISEIELRQMRERMNEMAIANRNLQASLDEAQRPVMVDRVEEVVVTDAGIAPRTVFFNIGSGKLSPQEEMNLAFLADRMKAFPDAGYTINGYADSATGTSEVNRKLSLERAQNVKELLVKKYGISPDRLTVAAGGGVDKFGQPILNRVVLVESDK